MNVVVIIDRTSSLFKNLHYNMYSLLNTLIDPMKQILIFIQFLLIILFEIPLLMQTSSLF